MTEETLIELQVEIPGRQYGRYQFDARHGGLRLAGVVYPGDRFPADLCAVSETLTADGAPLGALLLGNLSHPPGCLMSARPLGTIEFCDGQTRQSRIVAVAMGDPHFVEANSIADLPAGRRGLIELSLRLDGAGPQAEIRWSGPEAALQLVRDARQKYRLARVNSREEALLGPAWKPLGDTPSSSEGRESERHTSAEYAIHRLPYRFQQYVEEYLAPNERILCSIHRPSIKSARQRTRLGCKRLEEGIFVASDQQVSEVVELTPPDRADIRYGFVARSSVPERLAAVRVTALSPGVVSLAATLTASGGEEEVSWEFPASRRAEVEAAARLLREWLPRSPDRRVRRATVPSPSEILPPLHDPGANDPEEVKPLASRLEAALAKACGSGETVLARCLLPARICKQRAAALVAVTDQRLRLVPDPESPNGVPALAISLGAISSLQFCSTLLVAYLKVFVPQSGRVAEHTIHFGWTLSAMNDCYLMLRRAMAVVPAS